MLRTWSRSAGRPGTAPAPPVDDRLECEVLVEREVVDDLLPVFLRRNEHVAVERLEALQERDCEVVLVDDVVRVVGVAGEQLADEAAPGEVAPHRLEVDPTRARHAERWQPGHQ
jgi:hypothetical protein